MIIAALAGSATAATQHRINDLNLCVFFMIVRGFNFKVRAKDHRAKGFSANLLIDWVNLGQVKLRGFWHEDLSAVEFGIGANDSGRWLMPSGSEFGGFGGRLGQPGSGCRRESTVCPMRGGSMGSVTSLRETMSCGRSGWCDGGSGCRGKKMEDA